MSFLSSSCKPSVPRTYNKSRSLKNMSRITPLRNLLMVTAFIAVFIGAEIERYGTLSNAAAKECHRDYRSCAERVICPGCGLSQPLGRVINGNEIAKAQVPWLVKIVKIIGGRCSRLCGGSIITRNVVLTAAHCVYKRGEDAKELQVFYNTTVGNQGPCLRAERGAIHENYVSPFKGFDIALIKLVRPLPEFNMFFRPICLPRRHERTDEELMLLAGYGSMNFDDKSPRHILYYMTNALTDEDCDRVLSTDWRKLQLSSSNVLCSWNIHQLAWRGDSGSPVTGTLPNGKSVQYGIVSFVTTRKSSLARTVHTRVSPYRLWIDEHLLSIDEWEPIVTDTDGSPDGSCSL